jgi:hypothetical protein
MSKQFSRLGQNQLQSFHASFASGFVRRPGITSIRQIIRMAAHEMGQQIQPIATRFSLEQWLYPKA